MKHTALAASLMALVGMALVGCKSGPRTAWWKSSKAAESTAVAHSAPVLPSDLAKQAETHPPNAAQVAGGEAAPFKSPATTNAVAATAPTTYPQTGAPPFSPAATAQTASSATNAAPAPASSGLGNIAMPYDPSKAPQAKSTVAAAPAPTANDRYGSALANVAPAFDPASAAGGATASASNMAAAGAQQAGEALGAEANAAERYVADATQKAVAESTQKAASSYAAVEQQVASADAPALDRYGLPVASGTTGAPASSASPASTASVAAVTQPYRPGGTSSYPTVQVASRPQPSTGLSTPNVAVPSTTAPTTTAAPPSRY